MIDTEHYSLKRLHIFFFKNLVYGQKLNQIFCRLFIGSSNLYSPGFYLFVLFVRHLFVEWIGIGDQWSLIYLTAH